MWCLRESEIHGSTARPLLDGVYWTDMPEKKALLEKGLAAQALVRLKKLWSDPVVSDVLAVVRYLLKAVPKGAPGETPTDERLRALIAPLVPSPLKGDPGNPGRTPTEQDILALVRPLIPKAVPGQNGETPSDARLLALIRPLIPAPLPGNDAKPVNEPALEERLYQKLLAKIPRIETRLPQISLIGRGGSGGRTVEIWSGTTPIGQDIRKVIFEGGGISVARVGDGVAVVTVAANAPAILVEKLTPTAAGSNATLNLTQLSQTFTTIQWVSKNGQILDATDATFGWSRASNTITVLNGADSDIFLVSYTYAA